MFSTLLSINTSTICTVELPLRGHSNGVPGKWPLIIHELGLGEEESRESNQARLKNFNLNLILTCNIYVGWRNYV